MVHQPSGGARGQATDILIQVKTFKEATKLYNTAFQTCTESIGKFSKNSLTSQVLCQTCRSLSRYPVSGRGDHKLEETTEPDLCEAHWAGIAGDPRLTGERQVYEPTAGPGIWPH